MKKYAQNGEDLILDEYFGDRTGRLLDLGANNGHVGSNTLHFFEKGWGGVCIEPSWRAIGACVISDQLTLDSCLERVRRHRYPRPTRTG